MKKISIVFVVGLSFAAFGCKKKGGDCGKAIANSLEVSKADMVKMGVDDKMLAKMRDVGVQRCNDDKWSDDAIKCMSDAKTETEAQGCYGKLTPDQREKMNKAAMELTPPAGAGAGGVGSAGGSAGAMGSDTGAVGSAAAGSAAGSDTGSAGSAVAPK